MRSAPGILAAGAVLLLLGGCASGTSTGFSADRPSGYKDATVSAETRSGSDFEGVYEGPEDNDVTTSIAIVRVDAPEGVSLDEITRSGQRNVRRAYGDAATTGPPVKATLDGEPALRIDYIADDSRVRQLGAMRDGQFYLLSFTAARVSFDSRLADFEAMLRSWRWD